MNLCTVAEARTFLEYASDFNDRDNLLGILCRAITRAAEQRCNRIFERASVTDPLRAGGKSRYFVARPPITGTDGAGTAPDYDVVIKEDTDRSFAAGTEIDTDDYVVDPGAGQITMDTPTTAGAGVIQIAYTGGFTRETLPEDLNLAALLWIKHILDADVHSFSEMAAAGVAVKADRIPAIVMGFLEPHVLDIGEY